MILLRFAVGLALGVAGSCLLAAPASAQDDTATQRPAPPGGLLCLGAEPSDPRCPWRKRSATLLPSFTKTTTPPTTHHRYTTHHPTTLPANHTTLPANHTTLPANHTTLPTNHTTLPANHTTLPTNHTTLPANHTTLPTNHTTLPTNHTTPQPTNHTTPSHTVAPMNHTTPPHPTNRTTPFVVTTAPWPTDTPLVAVGNYVVQNGSSTCLRLQAGLQMQVRYTTQAQQVHWGAFAVQPNHTNTSGSCSGAAASLELRFPEGFLLFLFQKNETKGTSYLSRVQAKLTLRFPQARETNFSAEASSLQEFEASLGHSYQCPNRTLALADGFSLLALNERAQAFELQGGQFGKAEVCRAQHSSILVPILVFVAIAALVIIVLVAYAVGRRRSRVGYETL